jgi:hypothetical protein
MVLKEPRLGHVALSREAEVVADQASHSVIDRLVTIPVYGPEIDIGLILAFARVKQEDRLRREHPKSVR